MKRRNGILIGAVFVVVVLALAIALTAERGPSPEQKTAQARLLAERKTHLDQMKKAVDDLVRSGMVESADSPTDFYVDVRVGQRFYNLGSEQKKAIVVPIYVYYLTLRDKTESDIFALRLLDAKTGREVGAYQAGELQIDE